MTQLLHVGASQHRLRNLQADRRVDVGDVQQVGLGTNERHQRHDQFLADRVNRRIGHLREQLLEIGVQGLVLARQNRQGRIGAHRSRRLLAVLDHRLDDDLDVFLRITEGLLTVEQRSRGGFGLFFRRRDGVELDADLLDPLAVGLGRGQRILELPVVDDASLVHVDQEHLARLEAPLLDDLLLGNRQNPGLGCHDHEIVIGDQVARRTQAVAVERRADLTAVGEGDRGGAVPRLHHRRVVLVEGATVLIHQRMFFPGFGNHQHDRMRH